MSNMRISIEQFADAMPQDMVFRSTLGDLFVT